MTPTVLRRGPYRFFFFAGDRDEPRHVHVERDRSRAKFWLDPIAIASSRGFPAEELNRIEAIVEEAAASLRKAWDEFFQD